MSNQRQALYEWIDDLVRSSVFDSTQLVATSELASISTQICSERLKLRWPAKQKKVKTSEVVVIEKGRPPLSLVDWANYYYGNCLLEVEKTLRHLTKVLGSQASVCLPDNRRPSSANVQDWVQGLDLILVGQMFTKVRRIDDNYYVIEAEDLQHLMNLAALSKQR